MGFEPGEEGSRPSGFIDRLKTTRLLCLLSALLLPAAALASPAGIHLALSGASPADSHLTTPIDTTAHGDRWLSHDLLLRPGQPCAAQNTLLLVRGFRSYPCDSFLGVSQVPGQPITIRTLHRTLADCPPIFPHFFAVPVNLGQLAAGHHSVVIRRRQLLLGDNQLDSVFTDTTYSFTVVPDCSLPPLVHVNDLPLVDRTTTVPARPCPNQPVALQLNGHFPDGCGRVESSWVSGPGYVYLTLAPYPRTPVTGCPDYLKPWEARFPLGLVPAGYQNVVVDQTVLGTNATWPPIPDEQHRGFFQFLVSASCDTIPITPVPYVQNVHIGPTDGRGPICPSDSILVEISGQFPSDCCALKRIELYSSPIMAPMLPEPPVVRVVVDHDTPVLCLCDPSGPPVPWTGFVAIPPLPSRDYGLLVELLERGGGHDSTLTSTIVPFQVAPPESCGADSVCLRAGWVHQGPYGSCDGYVGIDREAIVTFAVNPVVPLSGLQGTLRIWEPGLRITAIEPVGPAAGMRLNWVRVANGARFLLFADAGAPIAAGEAQPILAVRAVVEGIATIPEDPPPSLGPVFHIAATDLLGADEQGHGVYECLPPPWARLAPEVAVLCMEQPCDFNTDGASDVRDVVLMVRCAMHNGPCPPQLVPDFDCDQSGAFDVSDVICCAMHTLRSPGCPSCPIDSVRAEPDIAIRFGVPERAGDEIWLPFHIDGAHKIGAARLRLRFPADRFSLETANGFTPLDLFSIQQVEGNEIILGLIGGFPVPLADDGPVPLGDYARPFSLHLKLRPGQSVGGEVSLLGGELSGPDGILLDVDLDIPAATLTGEIVELSPPLPNPFSGTTHFSVQLSSPARLEVSIFDLSGRRIAELFRGRRDAGAHDFSWDGRRDEGGRAANGVYFLGVRVDDRLMKRKLVLVRR